MPNHSFTFNGVNSLNMGIKVERFPTIIHARRKYERISVPGRNGDLLFPEEAFENYTQPYEVYAGDPDEWIDIVSWLMPYKSSVTVDDYINLTVNGYYQLTDTYEPDAIRLANYMEESDIANAWNKKGRTTLYFNCRPERFTADAFIAINIDANTGTASGDIATFEGDGSPVKDLKASIEPVQSGSGDPSPTNVRPISGWDAVNVTDCGKNLLDESIIQLGSYFTNGSTTADGNNKYRRFSIDLPAGTYTFSTDLADCYIIRILVDDVEQWARLTTQSYTFTLTKASNVKFATRNTSTTAITASFYMQIELGSTATAYEAYNGTTTTISLGSTIYGGTLDVTSGVLTVTHGYIASYNGETLPSTWISDRDVYAEGTTPTTGAEVVYELANPTTLTLTPTEVRTLLGENNIWADSGSVEVTFNKPFKNPTDRDAKPFIKVYGSGNGVLTINDSRVTITGMADYLHIDCEQQNCYRQLAENRNNLVSLSDGFPVLKPGSNAIGYSGGITKVEITPRWWNL